MIRIWFSILVVTPVCLTGCHSIFDADHAIENALASYLQSKPQSSKDSEKSRLRNENSNLENDTESFAVVQKVQNDLPKFPTTGPSGEERNIATSQPSNQSLTGPKQNVVEAETEDTPAESESSWDRIEKAIQKAKQDLQTGQNATIPPDANPTDKSSESGDDRSMTSSSLVGSPVIRIFDASQQGGAALQPISPLIQRPTMVTTPLDELTAEDIFRSFSHDEPSRSEITWRDSLDATMSHLEEELKSKQIGEQESERLSNFLRVLKSVDEEKSFVDLATQFQSLKNSLPSHHFDALAKVISQSENEKIDSRKLIAKLRDAVKEVAHSADLQIENPSICTEVEGFGKIKRFPSRRFQPDEEVLLYCELENFTVEKIASPVSSNKGVAKEAATKEETGNLHVCRFDAQIQFLNRDGETVHVTSFADIRDHCQTSRKDFYMFFRIQIPNLPAGSHAIQIRLNDKVGHKNATLDQPIAFEVVTKDLQPSQ